MDCRTCAKCCSMQNGEFFDVAVYPDRGDENVPYELLEYRAGFAGEVGWWMRRKHDKTCIALDPKEKMCRIYQVRPTECREFDQNHPLCKEMNKPA